MSTVYFKGHALIVVLAMLVLLLWNRLSQSKVLLNSITTFSGNAAQEVSLNSCAPKGCILTPSSLEKFSSFPFSVPKTKNFFHLYPSKSLPHSLHHSGLCSIQQYAVWIISQHLEFQKLSLEIQIYIFKSPRDDRSYSFSAIQFIDSVITWLEISYIWIFLFYLWKYS